MLESQPQIPLTIVSTLTATPGNEQQLRAAMLAIVGPSRRDPGNIDFNIHLAKGSAGEFVIIEHWIDQAALGKHKKGDRQSRPRNKTCQRVWLCDGVSQPS
jgi:quinol monooxygenase YgiN